uniref:Legume lectin domain-containing protein n=1 Tax=Oryza meridionalis TaxID=40149 RepID=A0A0E0C192_9ORYZ
MAMALLFLLLLLLPPPAAPFSLDFFPESPSPPRLALSGAASLRPTAVSMASPRARLQLTHPVALGPAFSTYFSFSLSIPGPGPGSLSFFLTPHPHPDRHPFLLAIVFDAAARVRIDLAGHTTGTATSHLAPSSAPARLHSWIHYNATSATLQLRLSATSRRPALPLLSLHPLPPSALLLLRTNPMLAGFTSSAANCTLFAWAFRANNTMQHSQPLDPSHLLTTPPPHRPQPHPHHYYPPWLSLLFAAACGAMLTFFLLFVWYSQLATRRPVAPITTSDSDVVYEKIVLVGAKDDDAPAATPPSPAVAGNNN